MLQFCFGVFSIVETQVLLLTSRQFTLTIYQEALEMRASRYVPQREPGFYWVKWRLSIGPPASWSSCNADLSTNRDRIFLKEQRYRSKILEHSPLFEYGNKALEVQSVI